IADGNARLVLFQNADDLIFGESAARHLWSSRLGQCLTQTGLAAAGNVTWNHADMQTRLLFQHLNPLPTNGYHRRNRIETKMHCVKLLGQCLAARDFDRQVAEFQVRVAVLNGFTALGTPITEAAE
ncbi:hypothetical protein ABNX41_19960, partial [Rhodobacteraceae bacterium PA1-206B]